MSSSARVVGILWLATGLGAGPAPAQWQGEIQLRDRVARSGHEPELRLGIASPAWRIAGRSRLGARASVRIDPRGGRVLPDLDEFAWQVSAPRWELDLGVREVRWGVLEGAALVDVINQRRPRERPGLDIVLGQPLGTVAYPGPWGRLELLVLPGFRPRPAFPAPERELWGQASVAYDLPTYSSGTVGRHAAGAVRWSRQIGLVSVALSGFRGTLRTPWFRGPGTDPDRGVVLPHYDAGTQAGMEVQWTAGAWIVRGEGRVTAANGVTTAAAIGLEFAPVDYWNVFTEYIRDGRPAGRATSMEDDFYGGTRLLYPDGHAKVEAWLDRRSGNALVALEVTRRVGTSAELQLEGQVFVGDRAREPALATRFDTSLALALGWYF